jgi:hypothetical protein
MARGWLLGLAAAPLLVVLYVGGQWRDPGPELGDRIECIAGQPAEPGGVLTCADLAACASGVWDGSPPPIVSTAVYATRETPASGPVLSNGAGGYVVVFDLADGGQRRVQTSFMCRPASG